ncbi:sulfurtransferase TusA family protein [Geomicrobium sp. JCM 19055]|uniref:sulfurtransferase TusA family protein n=1 Tax=Geomicrobium sp. JCM 19055 TaxID=1460649 RepID=UPI00045EDD4D|nr:sulfurtransferase TusA family protein [Geomicrobium sp. JCM 19055]GAK00708.1 rhodanese-like domain protein [Geomicrobium sp. JCM 19055]
MEDVTLIVDAKGLACPMPIVRTKKAMKDIAPGSIVEVQATDQGSTADLKAWAQKAGHGYLKTVEEDQSLKHYLRVGSNDLNERKFPHVIDNKGLQSVIDGDSNFIIVDVREKRDYDEQHIQGARSIPFGELRERMHELRKDQTIYVVCRTGNRSDLAAQALADHGYHNVVNVVPGMSQWNIKGGNQR